MDDKEVVLTGTYTELTPEQVRERVMRILEEGEEFQNKSNLIIKIEQEDDDVIRFTVYEDKEDVKNEENHSAIDEPKKERKPSLYSQIQTQEERVKGAELALKMAEADIENGITTPASGELDFAIRTLQEEKAHLKALNELKRENTILFEEEAKEIEPIQESFEELKDLRKELENIENEAKRQEIIQKIEAKIQHIEKELENQEESNSVLMEKLKAIEEDIVKEQENIKNQVKEYEKCYEKMENIVFEKKEKLSDLELISEGEKEEFRKKYQDQEEEMNHQIREVKEKIELHKNRLISLQEEKQDLEEFILLAEKMHLSASEMLQMENKIQEDDEFRKFVSELYQDIEEKEQSITEEEIFTLYEEAKEKVLLRMRKEEDTVLSDVDRLYFTDDSMAKEEDAQTISLTKEEIDSAIQTVSSLPEKIIKSKETPSYVPGKVPEDLQDVLENNHTQEDSVFDRITIFYDQEGKRYVHKTILDRFHIPETDAIESVEGKLYYMGEEDYEFIVSAANNTYSPYHIKEREISFKEEKEQKEEQPVAIDKIVLYQDQEEGIYYARKSVRSRFSLSEEGTPIQVDGVEYYPVEEEDATYIIGNANNSYSPYEVEIHPYKQVKQESSSHKIQVEEIGITLYRDINHEDQLYVSSAVLRKFKIEESGKPIMIGKQKCYPIPENMHQRIEKVAEKSTAPKIVLHYVDMKVKKKEEEKEPSLKSKEILERLTNGLMIQEEDPTFYTASNIQISKEFKKELQEGNQSYNIVHTIPGIIKAGITLINKLASKLILGRRGKKVMKELERRLDKELTDEECDTLLDDYLNQSFEKTSQKYMNALVEERLEKHAEKKLKDTNDQIKRSYSMLYMALKEIELMEKKDSFEGEKKRLQQRVVGLIQSIEEERKEAKRVWENFEEFEKREDDFPYLFHDEEEEFTNKIQEALHENQVDVVIQSFLERENLHHQTNIREGHYEEMAEVYGYRQDDFAEDFFQGVIRSYPMNHLVKETLENQTNHSLEEYGIEYWPFQDQYRVLEDQENTVYNGFQEEIGRKMEKSLSEYISSQKEQEDVMEELSKIAREAQRNLVEVTNEALKQMKPYASSHKDFDWDMMEEMMESIVAHPNVFVEHSLKEDYQSILSLLPQSMVETIVCSATSTTYAIEVAMNMEEKYHKTVSKEEIADMIDAYSKEQEETSKKKR